MQVGWRGTGTVGVALVLAAAASAQEAPHRPVVAELFTSEGCSSCPPAEAVLADLAQSRPDVLALAFHVTYWDRLGWADRYGLAAATARQRQYAAQLPQGSIYTPQLVVDGTQEAVGSDRRAVSAALREAVTAATPAVPLTLGRRDGRVRVSVGSGTGRGTVLLVGFDALHRTPVARGENGGRTLVEANVVRALDVLGEWQGGALVREVPAPSGEHLAALLQAPDGRILGAAVLR
jgi:hypothetical protein